MTRQEIIKKLEDLKELIACDSINNLTYSAREHAYICITQAIEHIEENEEE